MRARSHRLMFCLLLALLGTQWLGALHGVLHARGTAAVAPRTVADAGSARAHGQPQAAPRAGWTGLFDAHHAAGDCQLFDQASHGDQAVTVPLLATPACAAPDGPPRWMQRAWAAALVPQFDARAPPIQG